MQFDLSEEQELLKATLQQFLTQRYGFRERVAASRSAPGYRADIWQALAKDLGLLGVIAPEALGGLVGGADEQLLVMEEMGRFLCLEPVAETGFQSVWLLSHGNGAARALVGPIAEGRLIVVPAVGEPGLRYDFEDIDTQAEQSADGWEISGRKAVVVAAPWAQRLIVAARTSGSAGEGQGLSLFVVPVDAAGVTLHPYPTIDGRCAADIVLDRVKVDGDALIGTSGDGLSLLEEWRDRAIAGQAAEAAGLLDRLLSDTVAYCKDRHQFGAPIASYQALQHRMVDMHIQVELVRAAALLAAAKLDAPCHERARAASSAKVAVAQACRFVGQNAVQLHGGMGMTDELAIGHYFKRATQIEAEFGTESWHLARLARLAATAN